MVMQSGGRAIDQQFAAFLCRLSAPEPDPVLWLVTVLLSQAVGRGDICLDTVALAGREFGVGDGGAGPVRIPDAGALRAVLLQSGVVSSSAEAHPFAPLVLDDAGRLYLYRYWQYERRVVASIRRRSAEPGGMSAADPLAAEVLERLFPDDGSGIPDLQKVAARVALERRFLVVSGGPGTGKSSTVVRILGLLLAVGQQGRQRLVMAAPTGKAAVRLQCSVNGYRDRLELGAELRDAVPDEVLTVQRLLGVRRGSMRFRYHAGNPLPYDTVVVDEASMVALPLMAALLDALRPDARLILLGDKEQLASVEPGAVLGDVCEAALSGCCASLSASFVVLERNYRFRSGSGIGGISGLLNAGKGREALRMLADPASESLAWRDIPEPGALRAALVQPVLEGYRAALQATTAREALEAFDRFRILVALREGPYGVAGINAMVASILAEAGLISLSSPRYRGCPVMVTENDYGIRLFNGDTGMLFPDPERDGRLSAFFIGGDGALRRVVPERLPAHETGWCITVHKSQGSEFDHVLLLLPREGSELMTRELLYTGMTRAKEGVTVWGGEASFLEAVGKRIMRVSGLRDGLCGRA